MPETRTRTIVLTERMHGVLLDALGLAWREIPRGQQDSDEARDDVRKLRNICKSARVGESAPAPVEGGPPRVYDCGVAGNASDPTWGQKNDGEFALGVFLPNAACLRLHADLGVHLGLAAAPRGEPVRDETVPPPGWRWYPSLLPDGQPGTPSAEYVTRDMADDEHCVGLALRAAWRRYDAEHTAVRPAEPPSEVERLRLDVELHKLCAESTSSMLLSVQQDCIKAVQEVELLRAALVRQWNSASYWRARCAAETGDEEAGDGHPPLDAALAGHPAAGAPASAERGRDTEFNRDIGELDFILSRMMGHRAAAKAGTLSEPNRQTLKHHADDMVGCGNAILDAFRRERGMSDLDCQRCRAPVPLANVQHNLGSPTHPQLGRAFCSKACSDVWWDDPAAGAPAEREPSDV